MHASTPLILRKSRMRRRARTDLCGGRSVMIVPTATVIRVATELAHHRGGDGSLRLHTHRPGFSWQQLSIVSSVFSAELVRRAAAVG